MSRDAELSDKSISMPGNDHSKVERVITFTGMEVSLQQVYGGPCVGCSVLLPDLGYKDSLYTTLMRTHETTYLFAVFCIYVCFYN